MPRHTHTAPWLGCRLTSVAEPALVNSDLRPIAPGLPAALSETIPSSWYWSDFIAGRTVLLGVVNRLFSLAGGITANSSEVV